MKPLAPSLIALGAALALCAAADAAPPAKAPAPPRACFWVRNVNNFSAPDNRTLYVRVGVNEIYRLTLFSTCMDVDWVHHIGLVTRGSSNVCEGPNPDLDVVDREVGIGRQSCPVTDVHKLTPDEVAALPKKLRP